MANDLTSSRNKIVRVYYHRFEIEETFRDIKTVVGLRFACRDRVKRYTWYRSHLLTFLHLCTIPITSVVRGVRTQDRRGSLINQIITVHV